jgi:hypothetical protein
LLNEQVLEQGEVEQPLHRMVAMVLHASNMLVV